LLHLNRAADDRGRRHGSTYLPETRGVAETALAAPTSGTSPPPCAESAPRIRRHPAARTLRIRAQETPEAAQSSRTVQALRPRPPAAARPISGAALQRQPLRQSRGAPSTRFRGQRN